MTATTALMVVMLAASGTPGRLSATVSKEMTAVIVSANKALGLESWPMHNIKPCIDRGGQGITAKDVTAEETRKCADSALQNDFPELGKSYVLAIPMAASVGPITVLAIGIGDSAGWAAYSCDPDRKCRPVKIGAPTKWGKRIAKRATQACDAPTTLWFPPDKRACPGAAVPAPSSATTTTTPPPPAAH